MPISEVTIRSLGELIDAVTPPNRDPNAGRHRDDGVYHGASRADQPLLTTLDRLGSDGEAHSKVHLEAHILRNFSRFARPHLPTPPENDWELLVIAQHHGVPTRLLDWSHSPLVAAHFATISAQGETDCAVWRLDWRRMHRAFELQDVAFLIKDLSNLNGPESEDLTPWEMFEGDMPEVACLVEPPSLDGRIVAQAAAFTLCSTASKSFEAFLVAHGLEDALTKYVIPQDAIDTVRDQLDLAGVEERRLFPDIDGVAASLRRYYG